MVQNKYEIDKAYKSKAIKALERMKRLEKKKGIFHAEVHGVKITASSEERLNKIIEHINDEHGI